MLTMTAQTAWAQNITLKPALEESYMFTGNSIKPTIKNITYNDDFYDDIRFAYQSNYTPTDPGYVAVVRYGNNILSGNDSGHITITLYHNGELVLDHYEVKFDILPREVTLIVDDCEKYYGDPDPAFTCHFDPSTTAVVQEDTVSYWNKNLSNSYNLVQMTREAGETLGTYAINSTRTLPFEYLTPNMVVTAIIPGKMTIKPNPADLSVNEAGDEYTIHTATGWENFCDLIEGGESFSGKTVKLDADITVTRMAGSGAKPFSGTFDGQGHTLTLNYGTADNPIDAQFIAPFVFTIWNTTPTFRNLTIDGNIYEAYTGNDEHHHVGGLIGHLYGNVTIEHCTSNVSITSTGGAGGFVGLCEHTVGFTDCLSSAVIHSAGGNNSGFVGWSRASGYEINFEGCLFNGKLLQLNDSGHSNGGFNGWTGSNKTVKFTDCLCDLAALAEGETMASSNSATFARGWNATTTATNSYYTTALGSEQGKQAYNITAGANVTVALSGTATKYTTSGITAYKDGNTQLPGILYGGVLYAGNEDQMSLTLQNTPSTAFDVFSAYTASGGTLSGSANPYTLTMPDADVTIGATWTQLPVSFIDAEGKTQTCTEYTVIYSGNMPTTLGAGWYVVSGSVSYNTGITLTSNVTLILADNCHMNVGTSGERRKNWGIGGYSGFPRLTITSESLGDDMGALSVYTTDYSKHGIWAEAITINGGNVTADTDGDNANALYADDGAVTINGGNVSAITAGTSAHAIYASGNFKYNGGTVTATAPNANAIYAGGNYTFSWRTPADRITIGAKGLYATADKTATFSKAFIDEDGNIYSGTLTGSEALALLAGKTLVPYVPEDGYYLVGTMTDLQWQVYPNYQLTQNPANASEYMIQGVPLSNNTGIKTVKVEDGSITTWYKDGMDNEYKITSDGIYDIYFRPAGNSDWGYYYMFVQKVDNPTVTVTFAPEGFATYYNELCDVTLPAGVKARVVTDSGDKLTYLTIADGDDSSNNIVPAGTAVMLQTAANTEPQQKTLTLSAKAAAAYTGTNLLHGSDYQTTTTGGEKYYKLTYNTSGQNFGWYWGAENGAAFTIPGHKAWLALPASAAPTFFGLPDYETTGVTPLLSPEGEDEGASPRGGLVGVSWYTLDGRKLNGKPTAKGLYIYNGKKIIVK